MLEDLTHDNFLQNVDTLFHTSVDEMLPGVSPVDLVLTEVSELKANAWQTMFSVYFQGPLEPVLPQHSYPMQHANLGEFRLFIVPLGPHREGMRYEAVFNRLVK